ncbi:unnamed protein product, partial [Adineta ricciae]
QDVSLYMCVLCSLLYEICT